MIQQYKNTDGPNFLVDGTDYGSGGPMWTPSVPLNYTAPLEQIDTPTVPIFDINEKKDASLWSGIFGDVNTWNKAHPNQYDDPSNNTGAINSILKSLTNVAPSIISATTKKNTGVAYQNGGIAYQGASNAGATPPKTSNTLLWVGLGFVGLTTVLAALYFSKK